MYRKDPKETTEWDDIQRKLGNLPPLPDPKVTDAIYDVPEVDEAAARAEKLDALDADELSDVDDEEFMDDRFLEEYKAKRIAELKGKMATERFGQVSGCVMAFECHVLDVRLIPRSCDRCLA